MRESNHNILLCPTPWKTIFKKVPSYLNPTVVSAKQQKMEGVPFSSVKTVVKSGFLKNQKHGFEKNRVHWFNAAKENASKVLKFNGEL